MKAPETLDEYLDLVDQAIYEIDDILACAADEGEDDGQELSGMLVVYDQIGKELKTLHAQILKDGHIAGSETDLSFMPLVRKWKGRIPFHQLLTVLNDAHKTGI